MEKLEQYLDQVCRGIGGPVEMRQHVRQELREHLLDAIAQHKAAGMSDEDALKKALEEFGKPEEVRSDLEAAHGQRMTWILDKAMQWKEKTMKAKWLWTTWAYLGVALVIALQVLFITFTIIMIIPKFQKLMHDGIIDPAVEEDVPWMVHYLFWLNDVGRVHPIFWLVGPGVLWGLFEWSVRSENKSLMRLSALGTIAVALTVMVILMAGSLVIIFCLGAPAMARIARPWSIEQVMTIEASLKKLDQAIEAKDWPAMQEHLEEANNAAKRLSAGPAASSLSPDNATIEVRRAQIREMRHRLDEAQQAVRSHDSGKLANALQEFHKAFQPVREAAKRPVP